MNLQFYLEKLHNSDIFKKFIKENPNAFLCSGFFVIDLENKQSANQKSFDFFVPASKKMFSFKLEDEINLIELENFSEMEPLSDNCDFNFEEIENIIKERVIQKEIKNKVQRILLSLQCKAGENFLLGTVFISGLGMIKVNVSLSEMKITDFEKKSFFDMINVLRK